MPNKRSMKDKEMASHLKKLGVSRNSGACPLGCGAHIANGGGPLIAHLGQCKGGGAKRRVVA